MERKPFLQPKNEEEKKELKELLTNLKRSFGIRYVVLGVFGSVFAVLNYIGIYPLPWLPIILTFILIGLLAIFDLFLKKTPLKETVNRASGFYFVYQVLEIMIILTALHLSDLIPFVGALIMVLVYLISYFSFTRGKYLFSTVLFYTVIYIIVITLEYLGILGFSNHFDIGVNVASNNYIYGLTLSTGVVVIWVSFVTLNSFSGRLRATLQTISQKEQELQEAKKILEIKVKARTEELEQERAGLELRVKERTKELQERIEEMEAFQKLIVGRELKMVELKEEIKRLTEELEKIKGRKK